VFITFASGYSGAVVTPQTLAKGNETVPGVNSKAVTYLAGKKGARFGVVLFDFFGSDSRLAAATLSEDVDVNATPSGAAAATGSDTVTHLGAASTTRPPLAVATLLRAAAAFLGLSFL
jgi:1-phosphatidylinositol phosphodiesterase